MVRILIVEDEEPISNLIRIALAKEGYRCSCAFDGMEAADMIEANAYDLILLDVMLPGIDGFALMDYIRPMETPVIFITAMDAVSDRVRGLGAGADDYIIKPFDITELNARVKAVLRRARKMDATISVGGIEIDTAAMKVTRDGEEVHLTPKEYELLVLFAQNSRRALYRETIYENVWGEELPFGSKTVDLHVQRLRKKVGWQDRLLPVNKVGYRFEP